MLIYSAIKVSAEHRLAEGHGVMVVDPEHYAGLVSMSVYVWVTSENQLAKLALRGSSVLTQDFRGPRMGCHSGGLVRLNSCA